ncbi:hypothetical protein PR002_g11881 [Phytophthora rubi]|uniref:Uncharacterized protein n=1 Tax=Phytophthora rubi TaxID=129364 RepID=A0A6A3LU89_9STRA|nr:hypothetical protein PR002_g11881 [Phytophthora rubi]
MQKCACNAVNLGRTWTHTFYFNVLSSRRAVGGVLIVFLCPHHWLDLLVGEQQRRRQCQALPRRTSNAVEWHLWVVFPVLGV